MKLFIWDKVLCDYTCGVVVAVAPDLEEALRLIEAEDRTAVGDLGQPDRVLDPAIETVAVVSWGGG
jgi:SpoU rRNA methylase family enzyme